MSEIRIYVACLASYNAGRLHGAWIDANQDAEDLQDEIAVMLRASPCPNVLVECPTCQGRREYQIGEADQFVPCADCNATGKVPSAEEYAIHDHEGFEGIEIGEYATPDRVATLAALLAEHGGAYAAYVRNVGERYATEDDFRDSYQGQYPSDEDFAHELFDDQAGEVPEFFRNHLDWEAIARELFMGDFTSIDDGEGGVYVFSNR